MADKRAQVLDAGMFARVMAEASRGEHSLRDQAMLLLSHKAGLRACEIAGLRWRDVCDANGTVQSEWLFVPGSITKSGREATLPMHPHLHIVLTQLRQERPDDTFIIFQVYDTRSALRNEPVKANSIVKYFERLYQRVGFSGCSSHSGRRSFITKLARSCNLHECSIKDVQKLARHASLGTTERYVELSANVGRLVSAL